MQNLSLFKQLDHVLSSVSRAFKSVQPNRVVAAKLYSVVLAQLRLRCFTTQHLPLYRKSGSAALSLNILDRAFVERVNQEMLSGASCALHD